MEKEEIKNVVNDIQSYLNTLVEKYGHIEPKYTSVETFTKGKGERQLKYIRLMYKGECLHEELLTAIDNEYTAFDKITSYLMGFWQGLRFKGKENA